MERERPRRRSRGKLIERNCPTGVSLAYYEPEPSSATGTRRPGGPVVVDRSMAGALLLPASDPASAPKPSDHYRGGAMDCPVGRLPGPQERGSSRSRDPVAWAAATQ